MKLEERLQSALERKAAIKVQGEALASQVNAANAQMAVLAVELQGVLAQEKLLGELIAEQADE